MAATCWDTDDSLYGSDSDSEEAGNQKKNPKERGQFNTHNRHSRFRYTNDIQRKTRQQRKTPCLILVFGLLFSPVCFFFYFLIFILFDQTKNILRLG